MYTGLYILHKYEYRTVLIGRSGMGEIALTKLYNEHFWFDQVSGNLN
jgi:hypothetical protein